jgi:protein TonB
MLSFVPMIEMVTPPAIRPDDRIGLTLFFAAVIHAMIIFGVGFSANLDLTPAPNSIDVILVQTESTDTPQETKRIAQANQLESGHSESEGRPSNEITGPSLMPTPGISPLTLHTATASTTQPREDLLTTRSESIEKVFLDNTPRQEKNTTEHSTEALSPHDLEIAQLAAELARRERDYAQKPRINYIDTLSAKSAAEAEYIKDWVGKVEQVGNLNYPDEARRQRLSGSLILHVLINHNGDVLKVEVGSPSGEQALDDAAVRIVKLAAPFRPFDKGMRSRYDQLMITRTWVFQAGHSMFTQ